MVGIWSFPEAWMLAFEASISSLSPHSLSGSIILMPDSENPFEPLDKTASFEHTNWFTVRKAGVPESPGADAARDHICQAYWYPIYFYVRRLGHSRPYRPSGQRLTTGVIASEAKQSPSDWTRPAGIASPPRLAMTAT